MQVEKCFFFEHEILIFFLPKFFNALLYEIFQFCGDGEQLERKCFYSDEPEEIRTNDMHNAVPSSFKTEQSKWTTRMR